MNDRIKCRLPGRDERGKLPEGFRAVVWEGRLPFLFVDFRVVVAAPREVMIERRYVDAMGAESWRLDVEADMSVLEQALFDALERDDEAAR